ncbi:Ti-type conjugative transfer relaxase TraA [Ciceribacter azotifigens]|uniref:Ti-type conjugative transfer relaxase TraA n=1 Tax=Ciceribacter azotifigens TaxID=2069303 RepID=UPI003A883418
MAIMFVRAQVISRGAGRSVVSAAAYRHRARMTAALTGEAFSYRGGSRELAHEELALPDQAPQWIKSLIDGRPVARASEAFWNAVDAFEARADAQLAREVIIALPEELTRSENIALVRDFVRHALTSKGMVADWVYHDKDGNPHIHLMTNLRPLTEAGFGPKKVPVLGENGEPLRVVTPDRPSGKIVYRLWAGDKESMKEWKIAWAETANRHLALAGHDIRLDGRSYAEQGLGGIAQRHLGPEKAALARRGTEMYFAPADLAHRQAMSDRLMADPELLLRQLANERSTFSERDIARALHRYVDDPVEFANIRAKLMSSESLLLLRPQGLTAETGQVTEPAIFTTREILRTEYDMARSARVLSKRGGFAISVDRVAAAITQMEQDPQKPLRFDPEQVDAIRHVTGDHAIAAVVGLAGAGKSTLLSAARIAWESDNRRVIGAALAGKAAEGLADGSGIRSRTLASWELAWAAGREHLKRGDVLVIDEAGMVSSQQMSRVLDLVAKAGAKVVLVGDAMQLQPIQAGAAFRAVTERIGFAELSGVRRQRDSWARHASRLFARGRVEEGLDAYAQQGRIIESETRLDVIERLVADWAEARSDLIRKSAAIEHPGRARGDELLVLAHTNDDVCKLNEALRGVMIGEGALTGARQFQTARGLREFAAGDRIIFLENARFVEPRVKSLGPQYVRNGMLGTVVSTGDNRRDPLLTVRLDNGHDLVISEDSYRNVDHGYAATIHKSQGSTVERTFVLATGMMDQHLTYVAMTRHRDRADLYAAKEDFEPKWEWERKHRVDHAAGVTGELVAAGRTRFRSTEEDGQESPYADVKTDDGIVHRLWGVSLPKALEEGGISKGDTVTLHKDGVERVKVKVPVTDEKSGKRRFEEREVDRNVWTARQIETADRRRERIEREGRRPELFRQLVERLGRSGAKTTTLDFESEEGYQAHARDFARRRGIELLAAAAAGMDEGVSRRLAWIAEKRERVVKLWERASVALDLAIERERRISYVDEERSAPLSAGTPPGVKYLLPPATIFSRSIEEDARLAQLSSEAWQNRQAILRPVLARIYRDPDRAMSTLNALASDTRIEPRKLADDLRSAPGRLGRLRGSDLIIDGRAARDERKAAVAAVSAMLPLARAHAVEFRRQAGGFATREQQRRAHMALSVPALSRQAMARLVEIEAIREHGGNDAYRAAFAYAAEDRPLVREVKAADEALTARFGFSAFTEQAHAVAERNMLERMPEDLRPERREALVRLFRAIRRFADEQQLAERHDRSKIVAGASIAATGGPANVLPILAAVTEFKTTIADEARERALASVSYRDNRAALTETARRIWRDPAGAVDKIEALIVKGFAGDRIAAAVANDPSAYGALRGSGRVMNRMLASGAERKAAQRSVPQASVRLRALVSAYVSAFDAEHRAVTEERRRMAVAVPGLSQSAEEALRTLARRTKDKAIMPRASSAFLDPLVRRELASVSRALDERFGKGALLWGEREIINRVPPAQRRALEALLEELKALQQIARLEGLENVPDRTARPNRGYDIVR